MEVLTVTINFSTIASWTVIPESPQESQVLLTLTNPVENVTHVTLLECEEGDPDNINSTAKVLIVPSNCVSPTLFQYLPLPFVVNPQFSYVLQPLPAGLHFPLWSLNYCNQCEQQLMKYFEVVSVHWYPKPKGEMYYFTSRVVFRWSWSREKLRMNHFSVKPQGSRPQKRRPLSCLCCSWWSVLKGFFAFVLCFRLQFLPRSLFWLAKMLQQNMMSWQSLKTSRMTQSECPMGILSLKSRSPPVCLQCGLSSSESIVPLGTMLWRTWLTQCSCVFCFAALLPLGKPIRWEFSSRSPHRRKRVKWPWVSRWSMSSKTSLLPSDPTRRATPLRWSGSPTTWSSAWALCSHSCSQCLLPTAGWTWHPEKAPGERFCQSSFVMCGCATGPAGRQEGAEAAVVWAGLFSLPFSAH